MFEFSCVLKGVSTAFKAEYLPSLTSEVVVGIGDLLRSGLITLNVTPLIAQPHSRRKVARPTPVEAVATLSEEQAQLLEKFLEEELRLFEGVTGRTTLVDHVIRLKKGVVPIKQRYYPRNPAMQNIINQEVEKMLADGVIEESSSPWSSPVVLVKKSSGRYRFCIDFRCLNAASVKDAYPLPRINSILERLRHANFISTLDLAQGYWQVPLSPESQPLTAFTVPGMGLYQFKVMPFGLHSAGATFQRLLDRVIGPKLEPRAFAYLDDLVLISSTYEEHLSLLHEVFGLLREAGLKLNVEKCKFCMTELKYLGHVINSEGVSTDPDKVDAIRNFPRPTNIRSLRSFLGLASWYRRFVDKFAKVTAPMTSLLRKGTQWNWTEKQEEAFRELKERLTRTPVLVSPNFEDTFYVQVDASEEGIGASLTQKKDRKDVVIGYASRLLSTTEKKFSVTEKECLALVWAIKKFRPYLEGYHFKAITDHAALRWLMHLKEPSGRLARWILELQQHDFEVSYRKGSANKVADALSRYPTGKPNTPLVESVTCGSLEDQRPSVPEKDESSGPELDHLEGKWYQRLRERVQRAPQRFPGLLIKGNDLYRKRISSTDEKSENWQMCVPMGKRLDVLRENHDAPTAGHLGVKKTAKRVGVSLKRNRGKKKKNKFFRDRQVNPDGTLSRKRVRRS